MLNLLLAIATGVLLVLSFPDFDLHFLAAIALAPLFIALAREQRHGRRCWLGFAAGFVFWFGTCYWIQGVLYNHGGLGLWASWGVFLLFCAAKALHLTVFALGAGPLLKTAYALPAVAALWVAIESTHGALGFAWQALGNAGINMSVPLRLAPYTGVYGISFVFVMMSAAVALMLLRRRRAEVVWLLLLPLLYLLPEVPPAKRGTERAVLVQPNLSQSQQWDWASLTKARVDIAALSLEAALQEPSLPPRLLIWPEVPAPFYASDPEFQAQVVRLARAARTNFLFGVVAWSDDHAPLNSAMLIGPGGEFLGRYDKMNLVPFGEYIPPGFGFVNRITKESGDFRPGRRQTLFTAGGRRIGGFICYEAALPDFVRRFTAAGAEVLVNISNDGYFGRTAARRQHLNLVRMRAVENRRWILRATNDGYTVVIDPAGRMLYRFPPYERGALDARFEYLSGKTLYASLGDWFAMASAAGAIIALVATRRNRSL